MEEADAPKFVTPRKGTKNKKPTTFDGGIDVSSGSDSSSHCSSDSDDDDADLFPSDVEENHFSMLTPSDDDADLFPTDSEDDNEDLAAYFDLAAAEAAVASLTAIPVTAAASMATPIAAMCIHTKAVDTAHITTIMTKTVE